MLRRVLAKVYSEAKYILISFLAFISLIIFSAWLPNLALVKVIPIGLITALPSTLGSIQFVYLILVAVLFGISLSFSIYYLKHSSLLEIKSFGGLVLAVLGLGCASCGSLILTPILGVAAGGFLASLPLDGGEFAILGIGLMLWSLYSLAQKIDRPYQWQNLKM